MAQIFTVQHICAIILVLLAYGQYRFSKNYKNTMFHHGTQSTASYGAAMIVGNYAIIVILLVAACSLAFGPLSH